MSAILPELPGARVLDLYAGSGALGIEALSRGAEHVTFVESAPAAQAALRNNLASLGAPTEAYALIRGDALKVVENSAEGAFDIAFADPPYAGGAAARLASIFLDHPFSRLLCIEHSSLASLPGDPIWTRRYGDTALTFLASPCHES
jgi:16S rRNA (guanine966-N2)-methyltransferase